jgi:eukaryotic-like serine/threonine-protein kinase
MRTASVPLPKKCPRCGKSNAPDAEYCPADGARLAGSGTGDPGADLDPYVGTVVQGDIEIRALAGAGAMGKVYRAHQKGIDRDVAVKILHRELSGNASLVQRFHREAKIASRLQHPHVVEVYLAGQLADGALYIVMEFLEGTSLAAALAGAEGAMPLARALPIVLQLCDAVGEGHARGIVHRDLKPENVMLVRRADRSDWVKVLDFGIAKLNLGEQSMETAAGLIFGTARYISPEGAQGATVGPPGDVYSIAVILYQLLAGRTPFDGEQPVGLLIKHIHEKPPDLKTHGPARELPEPIARVVMENLAKDPASRAPNARAFGAALAAAARQANVSISDVGVVARMSSALDPTLDDRAALPPPPTAREPTERIRAALTAPLPTDAPKSNKDPHPKRSAMVAVVLAFLLGLTIAVLVMQQYAHRRDEEHDALVMRARRAQAEGRYTEPPGDNVRDLAKNGLARWPDDPELVRVQSDAAHELITRAIAARSAGDVSGARVLVRTASELDRTDGTAKLLLAQYDAELAASSSDGGAGGALRVDVEVPVGRARPGGRAELVAKVYDGSSHARIEGAKFVVEGPGIAAPGVTIAAVGTDAFRATFTPPREGRYTIRFHANVDGIIVAAERDLDVAR